jgi:hypothetical protein
VDIAHSLALQCRFTGHVKFHYSVGQHSILCAEFGRSRLKLDKQVQLELLLHDASEAYCADLARPVKHAPGLGDAFRAVEDVIQAVVSQKFGLTYPFAAVVHKVDNVLLAAEQKQLMPRFRHIEAPMPYPFSIDRWNPEDTEKRFLALYHELTGDIPRR